LKGSHEHGLSHILRFRRIPKQTHGGRKHHVLISPHEGFEQVGVGHAPERQLGRGGTAPAGGARGRLCFLRHAGKRPAQFRAGKIPAIAMTKFSARYG